MKRSALRRTVLASVLFILACHMHVDASSTLETTEDAVVAESDEANESTTSTNHDDSDSTASDATAEPSAASDVTETSENTEPTDELIAAETDEGHQENATAVDQEAPNQSGPFIDLLGETLLSLAMVDETTAQLHAHYTNEALEGKKVVGLYFSADWCGPCRQFTPDLVNFYNKMNSRKGKENQFEIVWISRCRDFESFGQYFTQMNWLAMQPEDAMGARGEKLSSMYKVKGIPTLVLLDEVGSVITTDGRNKIPADKAGIGFPWRNPLATAYITLIPKSLRVILKSHLGFVKEKVFGSVRSMVGIKAKA